MRTRDLARAALFAALIAICSWISIPTTVPFTLQTMGVFLAVGLLGGRLGSLAVGVYLLLGAVGLPGRRGGGPAGRTAPGWAGVRRLRSCSP